MFNALKVRHEAPTCESLTKMSESAADDLVWLIQNTKSPPWVGIRAAQCVIREHTEAKADIIDTWVTDPQYKGLAMLTFGLLDELPEAVAMRFATLGIEGPMAEEARKRLIDSTHPTVANLVGEPDASPPQPDVPSTTPDDVDTVDPSE